jgi:DNA-binding response OmpR family regulator
MSSDPVKILLIEDNPADARLLREAFSELRQGLFQLEHATRLALGLERLEKSPFDAVLLDLSLPDGQGIDNVSRVREAAPAPPIIVLTGFDDDRTALQAVRAGAQDYLVKDQIDGPLLARAIQYAIERKHAQETIARYQDQAALNLIANTASQSLQLEEILEITVAKVIEVTGCEMAHIRLRNPASGEITLVAHHGLSPEHVDTILARQELTGTLKRVFSEGELIVARGSIPVVINGANVSGESRLLVWVPLKAKGAVVGVLTVATMTRERFSAREVDLLKAIGNVVGIGLENARLFTETRRQLGRIEALRDISVAASSSLNLAAISHQDLESIHESIRAR